MKLYLTLVSLSLYLSSYAIANAGAVDEYGCHGDGKDYHCHGDDRFAKKVHGLVGINSKTTAWLYSDGPANYFVGSSIEAEIAFDSIAIHGSWAYQPLIFGTDGYSLSGWDVGIKLGNGLSRIGKHGFIELGYYDTEFSATDNSTTPFNSYQIGVGIIVNKEHWSFDGRLLYRNAAPIENYWSNEINIPTELNQYVISVGVYRRF